MMSPIDPKQTFPRNDSPKSVPTERCDHVQEAAFVRRVVVRLSAGHAAYLGDRVVGQLDRRMCLARLSKSLAFSDMPRR
jgi:hypothetical protein